MSVFNVSNVSVLMCVSVSLLFRVRSVSLLFKVRSVSLLLKVVRKQLS